MDAVFDKALYSSRSTRTPQFTQKDLQKDKANRRSELITM